MKDGIVAARSGTNNAVMVLVVLTAYMCSMRYVQVRFLQIVARSRCEGSWLSCWMRRGVLWLMLTRMAVWVPTPFPSQQLSEVNGLACSQHVL